MEFFRNRKKNNYENRRVIRISFIRLEENSENFFGLPMIEHVRRRACLSMLENEVFVATCDEEIEEAVKENNGKVLKTGNPIKTEHQE